MRAWLNVEPPPAVQPATDDFKHQKELTPEEFDRLFQQMQALAGKAKAGEIR